MTDAKDMPRRDIDDEKSLRQRKGLDGDAIEEDRMREKKRPREEIFEADASRKKPSDAGSAGDVDIDRAA